jgi:NAD+ diphosphatase
LPVWRGKIPTDPVGALGWVGPDNKSLLDAREPPVFLGQDARTSYFAQDISPWSPDPNGPAISAGFLDNSAQHHPYLAADQMFQDLRSSMLLLSPRDAELAATAKAILQWHSTHGFCSACGHKSDLRNAGWQRVCPACTASHFPRTDPVVIMLVTHGNRLLLGRSAMWPQGMYSLLAGFVEPGEPIEAAVRREVLEETGIKTAEVRYLASQPWPFPNSLMFGCIAEATTDQITLDPAELEDAVWVTREELVTVFAGEHPFIKQGRNGAIAHFLMTNWLADRLD